MRVGVEGNCYGGVPTYRAAEETLRGLLAREEVEADVELMAVNTNEEARRLGFPGSPRSSVYKTI